MFKETRGSIRYENYALISKIPDHCLMILYER